MLYMYVIISVSRKKIKLLLNFVLFQVTCVIGSLFQNTVNVVNIRIPTTNKEAEDVTEVIEKHAKYSFVGSQNVY